MNTETKEAGVSIKVKFSFYSNCINRDCIDSVSKYEIIEITGGELPALKYGFAPLPFSSAYAGIGKHAPLNQETTNKVVHKVGDIISDDAIDEFRKEFGVEVEIIE